MGLFISDCGILIMGKFLGFSRAHYGVKQLHVASWMEAMILSLYPTMKELYASLPWGLDLGRGLFHSAMQQPTACASCMKGAMLFRRYDSCLVLYRPI